MMRGHDSGYHIVSGVLAPEETGALLAALDALEITRGRAGARHLIRHAPVHDVANDPRLRHDRGQRSGHR
jgi:hypothetical protein